MSEYEELNETLKRITALDDKQQAMADLMVIFATQLFDIKIGLERIASAVEGLERR
jgi:hypothetical protein